MGGNEAAIGLTVVPLGLHCGLSLLKAKYRPHMGTWQVCQVAPGFSSLAFLMVKVGKEKSFFFPFLLLQKFI